ncbi:MAG: prepilin-type N-terminal cleavage/methylation domain-containing protein [Pirellulales bacterium]
MIRHSVEPGKGDRHVAWLGASPLFRLTTTGRARRGLTLVELLITISILTILTSILLFAAAAAQESARKAQTRSMISRLNALLMERWESYRIRRVPVPAISSGNPAVDRLNALRLLMQMEMPERWSEIATPHDNPSAVLNISPTALSHAYRRRYLAVRSHPELERHQGAECLYLLITMGTDGGTALEQFSDSNIGDTDGDGALEFLDGWGKPISFLRWPAGFVSDLQTGDFEKDHDPFDPFRADPDAYRLLPLIYSAGPDDELGIASRAASSSSWGVTIAESSGGILDPYMDIDPPNNVKFGQRVLGANDRLGYLDNIHSHALGP